MSSNSQTSPAACSACPKTFTRQADADRHYDTKHNRELDAVCPIDYCKKPVSNRRNDLQRRHMKQHHPGEAHVWLPWIPLHQPLSYETQVAAQSASAWVTPGTIATTTTTSGYYGGYIGTTQSEPSNNGNGFYYPSQATIGASPQNAAYSLADGYLSNEDYSFFIASVGYSNAANSTPQANGATTMLNSANTANRDGSH